MQTLELGQTSHNLTDDPLRRIYKTLIVSFIRAISSHSFVHLFAPQSQELSRFSSFYYPWESSRADLPPWRPNLSLLHPSLHLYSLHQRVQISLPETTIWLKPLAHIRLPASTILGASPITRRRGHCYSVLIFPVKI